MALITDLPTANAISDSDYLVLDTGSITQKITWANVKGNTTITPTASTNVTITSSVVRRSGNYVSGQIKFTTSAQISAFGYVFTGLPAFITGGTFPLYDQYNGLMASPTLYADTGIFGLRVGAADLPAGTYSVTFAYITQ